jgi:hypothetical protein
MQSTTMFDLYKWFVVILQLSIPLQVRGKSMNPLPWADHVDTSRQYIDTTVTSRNYPDFSNQIIQLEQHPFHYGGFANTYKGEYMGHTVSMNLIIFCLLLRFSMPGGY